LVTVKEQPVPESIELLPNQTFLLQATVDTTGFVGDRSIDVWASYQLNGRTITNGCIINLHVLPALRLVKPLPDFIRYEQEPGRFSDTIGIGDAFPDSGIEIESVSSSLPDLVTCEFTKIPDEVVYSDVDLPEWQKRLRKRYIVKFSFDREVDSFETILTIHPKEKKYRSLNIPVSYEGSQKKPKIFPSKIVVPIGDIDGKAERIVEIRIVPGKYQLVSDVSVSSFPDGIVLLLKQKTDEGWLFRFAIDAVKLNKSDDSITLVNENKQPFATVPILSIGSRK
jgi:hypothetical protein